MHGGALGALLGAVAAFLALAVGNWGSGEPMEGMMYIVVPLAFPVGPALMAGLDWGHYAKQWAPFTCVALPANWALWGALVGWLKSKSTTHASS